MRLNLQSIQQINLFENVTGAKVKDCINDEELIFIIEEGNIKKALGKDNANIKKLESLLKKNIKLIAYSRDVIKFVINLIYPIKPDNIDLKDDVIYITINDAKLKGRVYGRGRERLKKLELIIKKYFNIKEIKIE